MLTPSPTPSNTSSTRRTSSASSSGTGTNTQSGGPADAALQFKPPTRMAPIMIDLPTMQPTSSPTLRPASYAAAAASMAKQPSGSALLNRILRVHWPVAGGGTKPFDARVVAIRRSASSSSNSAGEDKVRLKYGLCFLSDGGVAECPGDVYWSRLRHLRYEVGAKWGMPKWAKQPQRPRGCSLTHVNSRSSFDAGLRAMSGATAATAAASTGATAAAVGAKGKAATVASVAASAGSIPGSTGCGAAGKGESSRPGAPDGGAAAAAARDVCVWADAESKTAYKRRERKQRSMRVKQTDRAGGGERAAKRVRR